LNQLGKGPVQTKGKPFEEFSNKTLETAFRNLWTDNADVLSILYTGTPALKTDFTRTGKRTYKGAIDDGVNSMTRYFINNFYDGYFVDCCDVSTKKVTPKQGIVKERPFFSPIKMALLGLVGFLYFSSVILNKYFPKPDPQEESQTKIKILHNSCYLFLFGIYMVAL